LLFIWKLEMLIIPIDSQLGMLIDSQIPMKNHTSTNKSVTGTINLQWQFPNKPVHFLSAKFDKIITSRHYTDTPDSFWTLQIDLDPNYPGCRIVESVHIFRFSTGKVEFSIKFVNEETKYSTYPLNSDLPIKVDNLMLSFN
jgi:hypothetical protein